MARLIDADKAIFELGIEDWEIDCKHFIDEQPTVDAVEVVHGEWLQMEFWPNGGTWRCSECGRQIMFLEGTPITEEMHYCPNCGAKMDGGDK